MDDPRTLTNADVRDIETLIHPYTNLATHRDVGPTVLERGKGVHVYDNKGRELIEAMAGLWCASLGSGNEELVDAAKTQLETLSYQHIFGGKSHGPAIELAEKLKEMSPAPTSKVLFCSSGSEANDTQIKLQWYYNNAHDRPEKKKIIARHRGYHGVTVAAASLTGLPPVHRDFDLPIPQVRHTMCPHHYREAFEGESEAEFGSRCAGALEGMILAEGPETIAAFIAEPLMGAGGVIIPPEGYFPKIQAVLDKYDIAMIADEVVCAFGRTGNMFGSETFDIRPDTISIAKQLTSAYIPLGAVTVNEDMYQAMLDESRKIGMFGHGYTYAAHPVAAAVANKSIEIYERDDIVGHVRNIMPTFLKRLHKLSDHPLVGEARGVGLIGAIEIVADKKTKRQFEPTVGAAAKIVAIAQDEGVILRNLMGDGVAFCPPLIITEDQINEIFDKTERALEKALDVLR